MMKEIRFSMPLLVCLALAACAARENGPDVAGATTTVRVENQAYLDMNVFVLDGTRRVRLGMVPGNSSRTFEIPDRLVFGVSSLRFQVDPVGSQRAPVSQEIMVSEGEDLRLIIPPGVG